MLDERIIKIYKENYFKESAVGMPFLMSDVDFVKEIIDQKNYKLLKNSIYYPNSYEYVIFLLNYHYDEEYMVDLLYNVLEPSAFKKIKNNRENLMVFVNKMRENGILNGKYDFEELNTSNASCKIRDEDGFLLISEDIIKTEFNRLLENSRSSRSTIPWYKLIILSKYLEIRYGKYDLLVDENLVDLFIKRGGENQDQSMFVLHKFFENYDDYKRISDFLIEVVDYRSNESVSHDEEALVFKVPYPEIIENQKPKENINSELTREKIFLRLMKEAEVNTKYLALLGEIVFFYPRYNSLITRDFLNRAVNSYLSKKFSENMEETKICLEFLAVCFQSKNPCCVEIIIENLREILTEKSYNGIFKGFILLSKLSVPIIVAGMKFEPEDSYAFKFQSLKNLIDKQVFDLFISSVIKVDQQDYMKFINDQCNGDESFINELCTDMLNENLISSARNINYKKDLDGNNYQQVVRYITKTNTWLGVTSNLLITILNCVHNEVYESSGFFNLTIELDEINNSIIYFYESNGKEEEKEQKRLISSPYRRLDTLFKSLKINESHPIRKLIEHRYKELHQQLKQKSNALVRSLRSEILENEQGSILIEENDDLGEDSDENINIDEAFEKFIAKMKDYKEESTKLDSVPPLNIEIKIHESTLCHLIDLAFNNQLGSKIQLIKVLQQFCIFGEARRTILRRTIYQLLYYTSQLKNHNDYFRNVEVSLEIIRSMLFLKEMEEVFKNSKTCLIRCLIYLFRYKLVSNKALSLLKSFEITNEVFDPKIKIEEYNFEISNPEEFYFLVPNKNFESEIGRDYKNFN